MVEANLFHVVPASIDFQIPAPPEPLPPVLSVLPELPLSPVPTYIIFGLLGSATIQPTAILSQRSLTFCQEDFSSMMLLLNHNPPATPPTQTFLLVESFKSQSMARVRPPTSFGPRSVHLMFGMAD